MCAAPVPIRRSMNSALVLMFMLLSAFWKEATMTSRVSARVPSQSKIAASAIKFPSVCLRLVFLGWLGFFWLLLLRRASVLGGFGFLQARIWLRLLFRLAW